MSDESLLEQLIQASSFGLDDLLENRLGYLSARQKSRLTLFVLAHVGAACVCFGLGLSAVWAYFQTAQRFPLAVALIWCAGLTLLGGVWIKNALPILKDLRGEQVLMVQGVVNRLYTPFRRRGWSWRGQAYVSLRVADLFFDIVWVAYKLLPEGETCKVYYTPLSKIIVGVEPGG